MSTPLPPAKDACVCARPKRTERPIRWFRLDILRRVRTSHPTATSCPNRPVTRNSFALIRVHPWFQNAIHRRSDELDVNPRSVVPSSANDRHHRVVLVALISKDAGHCHSGAGHGSSDVRRHQNAFIPKQNTVADIPSCGIKRLSMVRAKAHPVAAVPMSPGMNSIGRQLFNAVVSFQW